MKIGVPKEIKPQENRIGLTPESVKDLIKNGHEVLVENNGGYEAGFENKQYQDAGAKIVNKAEDIFNDSEIIVKVTKKRQEISISVENDGTKIKDNQIKSCFERFSQIGESGGAGLGLALVNEIAKLHNGSLTVSSKASMKFTFSIPA